MENSNMSRNLNQTASLHRARAFVLRLRFHRVPPVRSSWFAGAGLALAWLFVLATPVSQAQPPDDDLDRLLEQVESKLQPPPQPKPDQAPASGQPQGDPPAPKPGELGKEDALIDDLLKGLGETVDRPDTKDQPRPPGMGGPPDAQGEADPLNPEQKAIDDRLEEIFGIKRKQPNPPQDPQTGRMAEMIRKMRDVEQRLSQPDTGEQTRQKQKEILEDLDQAIEMARRMSQISRQRSRQPGRQGDPSQMLQEDSPSNDSQDGTRNMAADKPKPRTNPLANLKDEWGHLPEHLREEMNNVFKEEMLEARKALIERYYLSVARKSKNVKE